MNKQNKKTSSGKAKSTLDGSSKRWLKKIKKWGEYWDREDREVWRALVEDAKNGEWSKKIQ